MEKTRFNILKKVIENIKSQSNFSEINESLIIFDNSSSEYSEDEMKILFSDFKHVFRSNRNVGYWTALRWIIDHHKSILNSQKEYFYSIESDCLHENMELIKECENFLEANKDVGMVRTQQFDIANKHLYDKDNTEQNSVFHARQRLYNYFRNNEPVYFKHSIGKIYRTNFTAVVCGLARLNDVNESFQNLIKMGKFSERDYQKYFNDKYIENAIYDGGIFNSKLSFEKNVIAASRMESFVGINYRTAGADIIEPNDSYIVQSLDCIQTFQLQKHKTNDGYMIPIYRNWDSWHENHDPKMVYATTINPKIKKDIILHKKRTSFMTAISGNIKISFKLKNDNEIYSMWLSKDDISTVIKIPSNIPFQLENVANEVGIIINCPNPAWHPDNPDTIKYKNWDLYEKENEN